MNFKLRSGGRGAARGRLPFPSQWEVVVPIPSQPGRVVPVGELPAAPAPGEGRGEHARPPRRGPPKPSLWSNVTSSMSSSGASHTQRMMRCTGPRSAGDAAGPRGPPAGAAHRGGRPGPPPPSARGGAGGGGSGPGPPARERERGGRAGPFFLLLFAGRASRCPLGLSHARPPCSSLLKRAGGLENKK